MHPVIIVVVIAIAIIITVTVRFHLTIRQKCQQYGWSRIILYLMTLHRDQSIRKKSSRYGKSWVAGGESIHRDLLCAWNRSARTKPVNFIQARMEEHDATWHLVPNELKTVLVMCFNNTSTVVCILCLEYISDELVPSLKKLFVPNEYYTFKDEFMTYRMYHMYLIDVKSYIRRMQPGARLLQFWTETFTSSNDSFQHSLMDFITTDGICYRVIWRHVENRQGIVIIDDVILLTESEHVEKQTEAYTRDFKHFNVEHVSFTDIMKTQRIVSQTISNII